MNYQIVPLGEVCDFVYGDGLKETDRKGGDVPVYGSNGIVGWHNKALTKGETIVVGRKGSMGEVHLSKVPCWAIDTTYYIDKTKVPCDFTWLYYTLKALDLTRLNKSAAVPGLNREDAYEQRISLPPLTEQKRIASLLMRTDRLQEVRRTTQDLADELLQSVFLETFGDPETNPKGWNIGHVRDLCETILDCPHATPIHSPVETEYASIRSSDIQNGYLDWSTTKYVDAEQYKKRIARGTPTAGDVVYCREGARFGNAARILKNLRKKVCLGQRMMLFRANSQKATSEFLWAILESRSIYKQAENMVGGSAAPHVNVQDIKNFKTIIPPLGLQEEFAGVVRRVESLRARMSEAERQVEGLFEALLHQSFGEYSL